MEEVMNEIAKERVLDKFLKHFDKVDFSFDSEASLAVRNQALEKLAGLDFPTSKAEYWKYTRVTPLIKHQYAISAWEEPLDISSKQFSSAAELVFVNGFFRKDLSNGLTDDHLVVCSLSEAKEKYKEEISAYLGSNTAKLEEVFATLNSAYHNDGAFIWVRKNGKTQQPVHLLHLLEGNDMLSQSRNLIIADAGSEATIIESFEGDTGKGSLINHVSEFVIREGARLEYNKIQDLGPQNSQIATEEVSQQRDSHFNITSFSLSGKLIRNNLNISLREENAFCQLNGLYLSKGTQHIDNHTVIDHHAPYCESKEIYKGILNERSTTVFNGRVLVRRAAQKTNAFQSNANVLLTDDATANSKPELEIYADDVKCSHGSTTGQLDEEALFYLQARGIREENARNLLLHAFAGEVIEKSTVEEVKEKIGEYIANRYQNKF